MKTIDLKKAQPISGSERGSVDTTIVIKDILPEVASLSEGREAFIEEARKLADALWDSLPGGTLDALLIEMLDRKRSLFVVNPIEFRKKGA